MITTFDATPAMADGTVPIPYADRHAHDLTHLYWLKQAPALNRALASLDGWSAWQAPGDADDAELNPELAALGAVVFVYVNEEPSPEVAAKGGGRHVTVIGLNDDGTRAMVQRGAEWLPNADGGYPWATTANAT